MAVKNKLEELRKVLDERYENIKPQAFGVITDISRDSNNNIVAVKATIDNVTDVPVAVPYGVPLTKGAEIEVRAGSGKVVGPQYELMRVVKNNLVIQVDTKYGDVPTPLFLFDEWVTGIEGAAGGGPRSGMKSFVTVKFKALNYSYFKVSHYILQCKLSTSEPWETTQILPAAPYTTDSTVSHTFSQLEIGTNYDFRIAAVGASPDQVSAWSVKTMTSSGDNVAPAPPNFASIVSVAVPGAIVLDWSDNVEHDLTAYRVYYKNTSSDPWVRVADGGSPTAYFQTNTSNLTFATSFDSSTSWFFRITAIDASGNESIFTSVAGPYQPGAGATVGSAPTTPASLTGTWVPYVLNGTQFGRAELTWNASTFSDSADSYTIRWAQSADGALYTSWRYIAVQKPDQPTSSTRAFIVLNLKPGLYHKFEVSSVDASGRSSGWSNTFVLTDAQTTVDTTPPANVTGLVSAEDNALPTKFFGPDLQLKWNSNVEEDILGYLVRITSSSTPLNKEYLVTAPYFRYSYAQNAADHGGTAVTSVGVSVYAVDTANNRSAVAATGTFVNDAPGAPTGLVSVEDPTTDQFYSPNLQVRWSAPSDIDIASYTVEVYVANVLKRTISDLTTTHYIYTFEQNQKDNTSAAPAVRIDVKTRDTFGTFGPVVSKLLTNPIPPVVATFETPVNVFRSMFFAWSRLVDPDSRDFTHFQVTLYESSDAGGTGEAPVAGFTNLKLVDNSAVFKGTGGKFYRVGVKNFDQFGQSSAEAFSARALCNFEPIITPEDLAGRAYQITPTGSADIKQGANHAVNAATDDFKKLFDYNTSVSAVYAPDTTWRFVQYEFPVQFVFNKTQLSFTAGSLKCYLAFSPDGVTWTYLTGNASSLLDASAGTDGQWQETSSEATAQARAVTFTGAPTTKQTRWPLQRQAKYLRLWVASATDISEWKNDVYVVADTIDAGTLNLARGLNIYDDTTGSGIRITSSGAIFQNNSISIYSASETDTSSSRITLTGGSFSAYPSGAGQAASVIISGGDGSLWAKKGGFGGTGLSDAKIKLDGTTGSVTIEGDVTIGTQTGSAINTGVDRATNAIDANNNARRIGMPSIPAPASIYGAGLYLGSDFMGYYNGAAWKSYIQNNGNFYFEGNASNYIQWNGTALTVAGSITVQGGNAAKVDFTNVTANYAAGASVGGNALNTNSVGSQSAATVNTGVSRASAAIDANNNVIRMGKPGINAPVATYGVGLYLGADNLGYYNGSVWTAYIQNNGAAYFGNSAGTRYVHWDTANLTVKADNITIDTVSGIGLRHNDTTSKRRIKWNDASSNLISWVESYVSGSYNYLDMYAQGTATGFNGQGRVKVAGGSNIAEAWLEAIAYDGANTFIEDGRSLYLTKSEAKLTAVQARNSASGNLVTRTDVTPSRDYNGTVAVNATATITCTGVPAQARYVYIRLSVLSNGGYARVYTAAQASPNTFDFALPITANDWETSFVMVRCETISGVGGKIKVTATTADCSVVVDTLGYSL